MRRSDVKTICRIFGAEPDYSEPEYSSLFRRFLDDGEKISSELINYVKNRPEGIDDAEK